MLPENQNLASRIDNPPADGGFRKILTPLGCSLSAFGVVLTLLFIRTILLIFPLRERLYAQIPDDAFYYLVLARNHAAHGAWTFDGVAPATGFHLLLGYLLSFMYSTHQNIGFMEVFVVSAIVNSLCIAASAGIVAWLVVELYGAAGVFGVGLVFLNSLIIRQSTALMEAPLVIFCASVLWSSVFHPRLKFTRFRIALGILAGFLGMMARSDFGLQAPILLASAIAGRYARRWSPEAALVAAWGLAGGIAGLGVVLAHSYSISGHLFQSSALIKRHWSTVNGYSMHPSVYLLTSLAEPYLASVKVKRLVAHAPILAAILWVDATRVKALVQSSSLYPAVAAGLVIVGYVLFYSLNGDIQEWYCASLAVPLSLSLAALFSSIPHLNDPRVIAAAAVTAAIALWTSVVPVWPWQKSMHDAGIFLRSLAPTTSVGAWNAGLISFFSERPVINLDGVVNDDLLEPIVSNRLANYVLDRRIDYILDFPTMLDAWHSRRGGYADGALASCLVSPRALGDDRPENLWGQGVVTLFKVDRECLTNRIKASDSAG